MQRSEDVEMRVRTTTMREHDKDDIEGRRRDEDEGKTQKISWFALAYKSAQFWGCSLRTAKEVVNPSESGLSSLKLIRMHTKQRTIV
ncbi:hypothetical protein ACFX1R_042666 [Malus domestica]